MTNRQTARTWSLSLDLTTSRTLLYWLALAVGAASAVRCLTSCRTRDADLSAAIGHLRGDAEALRKQVATVLFTQAAQLSVQPPVQRSGNARPRHHLSVAPDPED